MSCTADLRLIRATSFWATSFVTNSEQSRDFRNVLDGLADVKLSGLTSRQGEHNRETYATRLGNRSSVFQHFGNAYRGSCRWWSRGHQQLRRRYRVQAVDTFCTENWLLQQGRGSV